MKKVKCEVCGEMVPQNEMSKSYRHRCKKCVADMTRAQRYAEKQKQDAQRNVPHTYDPAPPYEVGAKSDLPKISEKEFDEVKNSPLRPTARRLRHRCCLRKWPNSKTLYANSIVDVAQPVMFARRLQT